MNVPAELKSMISRKIVEKIEADFAKTNKAVGLLLKEYEKKAIAEAKKLFKTDEYKKLVADVAAFDTKIKATGVRLNNAALVALPADEITYSTPHSGGGNGPRVELKNLRPTPMSVADYQIQIVAGYHRGYVVDEQDYSNEIVKPLHDAKARAEKAISDYYVIISRLAMGTDFEDMKKTLSEYGITV